MNSSSNYECPIGYNLRECLTDKGKGCPYECYNSKKNETIEPIEPKSKQSVQTQKPSALSILSNTCKLST